MFLTQEETGMHDIDYRLVRDHEGEVVGQLKDHWVTDRHATIIGCVFGTGLYRLDGTHAGWCDGGRILDLEGGVLATVHPLPAHPAGFPVFAAARPPKVPTLKPRKPRRRAAGPVTRPFAHLFLAESLAPGYAEVLLDERGAIADARPVG
jgi:hypothetical protein